jgi:hypothetical protein
MSLKRELPQLPGSDDGNDNSPERSSESDHEFHSPPIKRITKEIRQQAQVRSDKVSKAPGSSLFSRLLSQASTKSISLGAVMETNRGLKKSSKKVGAKVP